MYTALYSTGPMKDAAAWFARHGHPIPSNCNPAEFLLDLVSVDTSSEEAEKTSRERIRALTAAAAEAAAAAAFILDDDDESSTAKSAKNVSSAGGGGGSGGGFLRQFGLLLQRSWRQVKRDDATNSVRLATSMNSAMVFGSIFWRMGRSQTSIQDRMGLLQVSAINTAMSALMKTLTVFTKEKVIVNRERASGSYTMVGSLHLPSCIFHLHPIADHDVITTLQIFSFFFGLY